MRTVTKAAVLLAAGAGVVTIRQARRRGGGSRNTGAGRWHSVTVNCTPEELGNPPAALAELGEKVEIRVNPAPGDRGTELAARLVDQGAGTDEVRRLRKSLREAKQLAEAGEVLLPDAPSTTEKTLIGRPLAAINRVARSAGRL
jgi:hypothetical protein